MPNPQPPLTYVGVSIAAAIVTIGLKFGAYALTQSVGLLSDAIEAFVNLAAALGALWALTAAARPPDERYHFGQAKAEYFSSGFEGALIVVAAVAIAYAAVERPLHPAAISFGIAGPLLSGIASAINLGAALWILKGARIHRSITLEADAKHLMADVWTSLAVLAGFSWLPSQAWRGWIRWLHLEWRCISHSRVGDWFSAPRLAYSTRRSSQKPKLP